MNDFLGEWDHLRRVTEQADDTFSVIIFTAWVNDMVCAVGYIGSIVVYGAGNPPEQAYTLLGLFIYATWNPVCYLVPCIMFDEEVHSLTYFTLCRFSAHLKPSWQNSINLNYH